MNETSRGAIHQVINVPPPHVFRKISKLSRSVKTPCVIGVNPSHYTPPLNINHLSNYQIHQFCFHDLFFFLTTHETFRESLEKTNHGSGIGECELPRYLVRWIRFVFLWNYFACTWRLKNADLSVTSLPSGVHAVGLIQSSSQMYSSVWFWCAGWAKSLHRLHIFHSISTACI